MGKYFMNLFRTASLFCCILLFAGAETFAQTKKAAPAKPLYLCYDPAEIKAMQEKYYREIEGKIYGKHPRLYCSDADFVKMAQRVKKMCAFSTLSII